MGQAPRPKYNAWAVCESRRRTKLRAVAYKGGACKKCGYDKCVAALQFHHRDPTQKDFTVYYGGRSWARTQAELDKCDMLCANCHLELHHAESEVARVALEVEVRALYPAMPQRGPKKKS